MAHLADDKETSPASQQRRLRVLVASHGHPLAAKGGAEIAAYSLFREIDAGGACETWFLGCRTGRSEFGAGITQPFAEREYVYAPPGFDWFSLANRDPRFPAELERLVAELRPDVVHFHHYVNFGVEAFRIVKRAAPGARVVLTLHEYWAICANQGQMATREDRHLCYRASPAACGRCFPEHEQSTFFVRERYIKSCLAEVDRFIAPSRFLRDRYVAWGLPAAKISVVENVAPAALPIEAPPSRGGEGLRVGFFGQISALKGIDVVFEAARRLDGSDGPAVFFAIHGDCRNQHPELQAAFAEGLARASRNVAYRGPYDESEVDALMRRVDAVVVPSIWWENSPLVIQEALRNRRPVICSDIGGMAEKVRDGVDGFHFTAGDPAALASLLRRLAMAPAELAAMTAALEAPKAAAAAVDEHLALYRRLLDGAR